MRCRSLLWPLCSSFCLGLPTAARAASDPPEATFWIRGVQRLYFANDSGRRDFAAAVGVNLPWELLLAQAAPSPGSDEPSRAEVPTATDVAPTPRAARARAAPGTTTAQRAGRTGRATALTASLVRETLTRAYRAQGAEDAEGRLESLEARSRWSAALPELRLRAARATDESQRLSPTIDDPYRYTRDGGTDIAFEVRLTWDLSGLVFTAPEVSVERIRSERAQRRAELRREVLKLLFAWHRARLVAKDTNTLDEEREQAVLTSLEAELTLSALTGGWFNERRPNEVAAAEKAGRRR